MVDVSFVEYPLLIPIVRGLRHFNFDILSRLFLFPYRYPNEGCISLGIQIRMDSVESLPIRA